MNADPVHNSGEQSSALARADESRALHPHTGAPMPRGRPFPSGVSGNPAGRPKGHKSVLRGLIGEHGHSAYSLIWKIAQGELSFEKLAREPGPGEDVSSAALIPLVRVVPSIRERLDAAEFLIEQLNGKATATVDLHARVENETRFDLSRLDEARLARLEADLALAATGDVVDVEFEAAPGLLPDGWTEEQPALAAENARPHEHAAPVVEYASVFPVDCETAHASDYVWETRP